MEPFISDEKDDDTDAKFAMSSADLTLKLLSDAGEMIHSSKKRKRGDTVDDTRNILNLHLLMCQPTSNLGTPIELSREEVKAHQDTIKCFSSVTLPTVTKTGPIRVEVKTVEDDNRNLIFQRPGRKDCVKGRGCAAFLIEGPPQLPLSVYDGPSGDETGLCLLCIRTRVSVMCQMFKNEGCKPCTALLPPFTNICNASGGYHEKFMGIVPSEQETISGGVYIMGSSTTFSKRYDAENRRFYIDQGESIYRNHLN